MSRISELKEIDALEIVPLGDNRNDDYPPFEGVKIGAYHTEPVKKIITELEAENQSLRDRLEKIHEIVLNYKRSTQE